MWSSLGDEPLPQHPRWVPEPDGRGTYGILSSCIITLTLCVWTCLHVDVPDHENSDVHRAWIKTKWMLGGVFMPEFVVYMAGVQWLEQRALTRDMERAFGGCSPPRPQPWYRRALQRVGWAAKKTTTTTQPQPPRPGVPMRRHAWTTTHSFLAVAGGFAFDNSLDPEGVPFINGRQRLTVLQTGLCTLAHHAPDLVPDVSLEAIRDKSKSDRAAQLVACVQAVWFCAQMIARMAQHLPLTILELMTFAHAVCAILVYVLWWDKPLDVEEPFLIPVQRNTRAAALCIRLCGNHAWTTRPVAEDNGHGDDHGRDVEAAAAGSGPGSAPGSAPGTGPGTELGQPVTGSTSTRPGPGPGPGPGQPATDSTSTSTNYYEMAPTPKAARPTKVTVYGMDVRTEDLPPPVVLYQHDPKVEWASDWYSARNIAKLTTTTITTAAGPGGYRLYTLGVVDFAQRNETPRLYDPWLAGGALAISALYSGWHLTAWQGPFHGAATKTLWSIAAIAPTPVVMAMVVASLASATEWRYADYVYLLGLVFALFSRGFMMVESLIGLAYAPDGSFQEPDWSPYFPHIGS